MGHNVVTREGWEVGILDCNLNRNAVLFLRGVGLPLDRLSLTAENALDIDFKKPKVNSLVRFVGNLSNNQTLESPLFFFLP